MKSKLGNDTTTYFRVPYKELVGQNKTQKERVIISFSTIAQFYPNVDSIQYSCYVVDRNANFSDTIKSEFFPFAPGEYK